MKTGLLAALALAATGAAQAVIQTTGGGFSYEFLEFSAGGVTSAINPTNAGCAAGGNFQCDPMTFSGGVGGTLTVTSPDANQGYQDLSQDYRGLGVVDGSGGGNLAIDGDEVLTLSFANVVNLVGYHLSQYAGSSSNFLVSVDGGAAVLRTIGFDLFAQDNGNWLTGKTFSFSAADNEAFYVGAVKITSAVPEPATYGLMLAGLGVVGFAARRRRAVG